MYNEVKKQITKKHVIHSVYRTHPDDPGASNIFAAPRWTGGLMAAMLSMVLAASLECSDAFSSRSFATSSQLFREVCGRVRQDKEIQEYKSNVIAQYACQNTEDCRVAGN